LGIGLRDGDVLTHVEGRLVATEADVVSLVLSSRGAKVPRLQGTVWQRGRGRRSLVVDQPYLTRAAP
jgi:S1-C subfamily serine protease